MTNLALLRYGLWSAFAVGQGLCPKTGHTPLSMIPASIQSIAEIEESSKLLVPGKEKICIVDCTSYLLRAGKLNFLLGHFMISAPVAPHNCFRGSLRGSLAPPPPSASDSSSAQEPIRSPVGGVDHAGRGYIAAGISKNTRLAPGSGSATTSCFPNPSSCAHHRTIIDPQSS